MEEEKIHSNWREQILQALTQGHITTIIDFNGQRYSVTLKPYEALPKYEAQVGDTSTCSMCGHPIEFMGEYWDHTSTIKPRHPALPHGRF